MDITFKDVGGNRVGFIIGNDVKDTGGNRVGFINGNDIKDSGGNRIGYLNGNDFKDTFGNRVGFINGNDIKDNYGNRVGYAEVSASDIQMCAAGLLLLNLGSDSTNSTTSSYNDSVPTREKRSGCLGMLGAYFFFLLKANWGGKIGLILGVIVLIILFVAGGDALNNIFVGLFAILLLGTIGAAIGGIVKFIKRQVDKNKK